MNELLLFHSSRLLPRLSLVSCAIAICARRRRRRPRLHCVARILPLNHPNRTSSKKLKVHFECHATRPSNQLLLSYVPSIYCATSCLLALYTSCLPLSTVYVTCVCSLFSLSHAGPLVARWQIGPFSQTDQQPRPRDRLSAVLGRHYYTRRPFDYSDSDDVGMEQRCHYLVRWKSIF